jgi:uncharacterized protein (TIGR02594 family)
MTPWLDIAEGELGVKERRGSDHHPRILEYLATTSLGNWAKSRDETAWCAAFVGWCLLQAHVEPTRSALARSYTTWQQKVEPEEWQLGDVCVLRNKRRGNYHVGFPYRIAKRHIVLLGGNQSDAVCFSRYPFRRWEIVAVRRPA